MQYDYADSKTGANAKHFGRTLFIFGTWGKTDVLQDLIGTLARRSCGPLVGPDDAEFLWKPKISPRTVNYVYGWDIVPRLFWLIRRNYGKAKKIKGKGFHPFTDHLRYPALKQFGIKGLKEEL